MTYTLWQLIATLNEWFFPGSDLEKNYTNICNCNNSLQIFTIFLYITGTSTTSQAPPAVCLKNPALFGVYRYLFSCKQVYLHHCTKINRFVCKISAFRTKNDRYFSVSNTSGWLRSHFEDRIFGKYGKFWGIWRATKLYAYKGRKALFDYQWTLWLLCILSKKTNIYLFISSFRPSQVAPDICHNNLIGTAAEVPVIVYQACFSRRNKCLGNLASYVFQHRRRLQCVLFDMLNKYLLVQTAENTFILHWKISQTRNTGLPISGWKWNKK